MSEANVDPLREVAEKASGVWFAWFQVFQQMLIFLQTVNSTINLTMGDPALELRQNLLRDGDHSALLGTIL
ncbi:MAG TPA: hypothetical protein VFA89_02345 [Terriglobales bacterium]|nr:hypothetical protein [Terriglobales bacterium]